MAKLIGIGEILVEIMAEEVGQTFLKPGKFLGPYPSGAPAICMDQAARLGADCAMIACVGDDDFGKLNVERLRGDGVDVSGIVCRRDKVTGVAFVTYQQDGDRKFIFHFTDAAPGALSPADIRRDQLKDAEILHVMGCSLSASDTLREAVLEAAHTVKEAGGKISFDPNFRPELLGIAEIQAAFRWILENCDMLLTGRSELEMLTGEEGVAAAKRLLAGGVEIVVLKSGSRGARILTPDSDEVIPSYSVTEVDPTGAGDCFDGAILAMLLNGKTPAEAARIANAAGAFSVTRRGPMEGAATPADIRKVMGMDPAIG